ncbi:MAG: DUF1538 family protein [Spirochaetaceae bacterium]|nr:DUF1538 family protein [Spirochaetaceae bacterium]
MVGGYARAKLGAQATSIAFIVLYLVGVQTLVFRMPVANALGVALGIGAVAAGLALFLEGLFLGVMPLGERCGLKLPTRTGTAGIVVFSLVLGVVATLAEPAIGFLRGLGGTVEPWRAPLLYALLNRLSPLLVAAVAAGVGVAVVFGVLRFIKGWSLKPFIFVLTPILLAATFFAEADPRVASAAALAWDSGGVTTGPVTVPLVIALGVGLSRLFGEDGEAGNGLGVVTLASALPVLAVLLLSFALAPRLPAPSAPEAFFAPAAREKALFVLGSEAELERAAARVLSPAALAAAFPAPDGAEVPAADGATDGAADGAVSAPGATGAETAARSKALPASSSGTQAQAAQAWTRPLADALKAVIPLVIVLLVVLRLILGEKIQNADELLLGLVFAVAGMFLFGLGMDRGLGALGRQAGNALPAAYAPVERTEESRLLRGVGEASLVKAAGEEGVAEYLLIEEERGPALVPFDRGRYDAATGDYLHVPVERPLLAGMPDWLGRAAVLLFVFVLGIGATLAEPSLAALGATLEEITTGTYKSAALVRTVAIGVGAGMAAGFARILFGIPLLWILVPPYALALLLTAFSAEDFTAIAWDSAGVTTGPVTVPLVIAAGLGIGESAGVVDGFGVVAAASVFPVLAVLASGLAIRARGRRNLDLGGEEY